MNRRLTLINGQPYLSGDVTSSLVYYTGGGLDLAAPPPLDVSQLQPSIQNFADPLAGLSGYDVFFYGGALWAVPMPSSAPTFSSLSVAGATVITTGTATGETWTLPSAAFDGITNKNFNNSAVIGTPGQPANPGMANYVGFDLGVGNSAAVQRFDLTAPNDDWFMAQGSTVGFEIDYSDDLTNWTQSLYGGIQISSSPGQTVPIILPPQAKHRAWRVGGGGNGTLHFKLAQAAPFTASYSARGIDSDGNNWLNTTALTGQNGSSTLALPSGAAPYVGSILMDFGPTVSFLSSYGLDRVCGLWNPNDDAEIVLRAGNPSPAINGHFGYTPASGWPDNNAIGYVFTPTQGNSLIRLRTIQGLPKRSRDVRYEQGAFINTVNAGKPQAYWVGVGVDGNTVPFGRWGQTNHDDLVSIEGSVVGARYCAPPAWGPKVFNALEGQRNGASASFGEDTMLLSAPIRY